MKRFDRPGTRYWDHLPEGFTLTPFDTKTYRELPPMTVTLIDDKLVRRVDFRAAVGCGIDLLVL